GTLTLNNSDGTFTYRPNTNVGSPATTTDSFTYFARDPTGTLSQAATVTITVNHVNQPPFAGNGSYTVPKNTTTNIASPGVFQFGVTDPDGDALSVSIVNPLIGGGGGSAGQPVATRYGVVTVNTTGAIQYTPALNFVGDD